MKMKLFAILCAAMMLAGCATKSQTSQESGGWSVHGFDPAMAPVAALDAMKKIDCSIDLNACRYYAAVEVAAYLDECPGALERKFKVTIKPERRGDFTTMLLSSWSALDNAELKDAVLSQNNRLRHFLDIKTREYLKGLSANEMSIECSRLEAVEGGDLPENMSDLLSATRNYQAFDVKRAATTQAKFDKQQARLNTQVVANPGKDVDRIEASVPDAPRLAKPINPVFSIAVDGAQRQEWNGSVDFKKTFDNHDQVQIHYSPVMRDIAFLVVDIALQSKAEMTGVNTYTSKDGKQSIQFPVVNMPHFMSECILTVGKSCTNQSDDKAHKIEIVRIK